MSSFLGDLFGGLTNTDNSNSGSTSGSQKNNFLFGSSSSTISGYFSGVGAKDAANTAAKQAESARRQSIIGQMGAKQQADSMALAGLKSSNSGTSNGAAQGNNQKPGGFIGSNLNTAGTFTQG
jgi:hypothetical protein